VAYISDDVLEAARDHPGFLRDQLHATDKVLRHIRARRDRDNRRPECGHEHHKPSFALFVNWAGKARAQPRIAWRRSIPRLQGRLATTA